MTWFQRLVNTYDACLGAGRFDLPPISHTPQQAHIEIVIDGQGQFLDAKILESDRETLIPVIEDSESRTSGVAPHPLCDKIQYVAADYVPHGGLKKKDEPNPPKNKKGKPYATYLAKRRDWESDQSYHPDYLRLLTEWCNSSYSHPKSKAVLAYIKRGTVVADLIKEGRLVVDENGKLITKKQDGKSKSKIFRVLGNEKDQGGAMVRWRVNIKDDLQDKVWEDSSLQESWAKFYASKISNEREKRLCMIKGTDKLPTTSHPRYLRYSGDSAKLISSNDETGFTFRGRLIDSDQACSIGYEESQKAHIALRWLIKRQGFARNELAVVAWEVAGRDIPHPNNNPFKFNRTPQSYRGDVGEKYALELRAKIAGYRKTLSSSKNIVVMAFDSATKGRLAVTFYREFSADEFLRRIDDWHFWCAWDQNYGDGKSFVGAPTPRDIAMIAYPSTDDDKRKKLRNQDPDDSEEEAGPASNDNSVAKLRKACTERLLNCILDGRPLPRDLVETIVHRVSSRIGMKAKENDGDDPWGRWNKALGIACALYRGYEKEKEDYKMALENDRTTRDYLYGRLLAVADRLEERALTLAEEKRDTTAARYMQRFSNFPLPTWLHIAHAILPYKRRFQSLEDRDYLMRLEQLMNQIHGLFQHDDFVRDGKLSGEYLLGYYCQRAKLFPPKSNPTNTNNATLEIGSQGDE